MGEEGVVLGRRSPGPEAVALTSWGNFAGETGSDVAGSPKDAAGCPA